MAVSVVAAALNPVADSVGPGGTAAIVVFALILACVVIILAMLGSLKRLRRNTSNGTFNTVEHHGAHDRHGPADTAAQARKSERQVTQDPGSGGAGA